MADYIKREDAQDILEQAIADDWEMDYAIDRLNERKSADVRPVVHARWVDTQPELQNWQSRKDGMAFYCSACKHRAGKHKHTTYQYCPWCGAMMDGGGQRC